MSQQTINIGAVANDGTGDAPRTAFTKVNANFTELYDSYRELITAARTYYVDSAGNDLNTGLSPGVAFQTIQRAINVISRTLTVQDGVTVTVSIANGTYTITTPVVIRPVVGGGSVLIQGNTGTPASVIINSVSSQAAMFQQLAPSDAQWRLTALQIQSTANPKPGIQVQNHAVLEYGNVIFGIGLTNQIEVSLGGGVTSVSNYTIIGGATTYLHGTTSGILRLSNTVTLTGTPAFSAAFARATNLSVLDATSTVFSGSATGTRFAVSENSVIQTAGGGANFFPGNAVGTTATGGQYV